MRIRNALVTNTHLALARICAGSPKCKRTFRTSVYRAAQAVRPSERQVKSNFLVSTARDHTDDAFGNTVSETAATTDAAFAHLYGYTGREFDRDTGLQYNRARYYDPSLGRFISQDPIGFKAGDANLYRMAGNHTTYASDPSGLEEPAEDGRIVRPGEDNRLFYIFAFEPDHGNYIVRKTGADGTPRPKIVSKNGIRPTGPTVELHPLQHVLNQHERGPSPYTSASTLPNGAPEIRGEPVWIDVNKLENGQLLTYKEIVKQSREYVARNPEFEKRFEVWKNNQANEAEVLVKGNISADAVYTKNAMRVHAGLRVAGKVMFVGAVMLDTWEFFDAEDKSGEAARIAGGWTGAWAGGTIGAGVGAGSAGVGEQLGPQVLIPEEIITVPVCAFFGGLVGSAVGYYFGSIAGRNYYAFIKDGLEQHASEPKRPFNAWQETGKVNWR